jgi:hypothetical protein
MQNDNRLFVGVFPAGLSYADRKRSKHGDYAPVAFLDFATLTLRVEADAASELIAEARAHAATIVARKGQAFSIDSCGHTVVLGRG